jgi:hypothetical protein
MSHARKQVASTRFLTEVVPGALKRVSWLIPLLLAAGLPGSTAGCGTDSSGPSCASEGETCGFFVPTRCCDGLNCNEGKCS